MRTVPTTTLADGNEMPLVGLGTWQMDNAEAELAVTQALRLGYRLIDTAASYGNEIGVGRAIAASGVPREEVMLTTKLQGRDHGYDKTLKAAKKSLQRLGVEYLDLYLIHWPQPRVDLYAESWRAMIELRDSGLLRSIGVSNFNAAQLDRLIGESGVTPVVNQIEVHPYFSQERLRAENAKRKVQTQSWSPLGNRNGVLRHPAVLGVAEAHGVTPGQALLRWHLQLGSVAIPKSSSLEHQQANLDIFEFELSDADMAAIGEAERP